MRKEKIQDKQTNFEKLSHASRSFGHSYIQIIQDYIYCPRHKVPMGFSTVLSRTCDSALASRWQILLDFYEDETGTFPIATRLPTLRCKTEVSRAMEPLGQTRSRTSLQDRNPACKRNLRGALRCKIGIPRAKLFESNVRHPWKGSGPLSDEESYWQTSQTLLLELQPALLLKSHALRCEF